MFCTQISVPLTAQYNKYVLLRYFRIFHVINLPITKLYTRQLKKNIPLDQYFYDLTTLLLSSRVRLHLFYLVVLRFLIF